jgi:hypothetical protein
MTYLNPNTFLFHTSIQTYNISFKGPEHYLSNATIFALIARLVSELQWIEKGTLKITNQSQAVIRLVWTLITSVSTRVLKHTIYHSKAQNRIFLMQSFSHHLPYWLLNYCKSKKVHWRLPIKAMPWYDLFEAQ